MFAWHSQSPEFDPQNYIKLGDMVHACNLSTREIEPEGTEFKASFNYKVMYSNVQVWAI